MSAENKTRYFLLKKKKIVFEIVAIILSIVNAYVKYVIKHNVHMNIVRVPTTQRSYVVMLLKYILLKKLIYKSIYKYFIKCLKKKYEYGYFKLLFMNIINFKKCYHKFLNYNIFGTDTDWFFELIKFVLKM